MAESKSEEITWRGRPLKVRIDHFKAQKRYHCPFDQHDFYDPAHLIKHLDAEHLHWEFLEGRRFELIVFHRKGDEKRFHCLGCGREDRNPRRLAEHQLVNYNNRGLNSLIPEGPPQDVRPTFVSASGTPPAPSQGRNQYSKEIYHPGGSKKVVYGPEEHEAARSQGWEDEPRPGRHYVVWTADIADDCDALPIPDEDTFSPVAPALHSERPRPQAIEAGGIPSTEAWGDLDVRQQVIFRPVRHSFSFNTHDPVEVDFEDSLLVLLAELQATIAPNTPAPEAADWILGRITGRDNGRWSFQEAISAAETQCRQLKIQALRNSNAAMADVYTRLLTDFQRLQTRSVALLSIPASPLQKAPDSSDLKAETRQAYVVPLLDARGWTRGRWASEAGLSKNSVYDYLNGKRDLSAPNRKAMAEVLDLDPTQLPD